MSNFPWGLDPEDAPLGTHTYRCKGCNGKNCRVCCFGDMWEQDVDAFGREVVNYVLENQSHKEEQDET